MKALYGISIFFYLIAAIAFVLLIFEVSLPIAVNVRWIGSTALGVGSLFLLVASICKLVAMKRDR